MPVSTNKIIVPEAVVFQTVKAILAVIREDYAANINAPTNSWLYRCIGVYNNIQGYDLAAQAVAVFIGAKNPNEPRFVDISMGWDSDRIGKKNPTIHLILQNESPKDDSLGLGSGNNAPIFNDATSEYVDAKERRFGTQINLLITGDNSNEKLLIYHVLKSALIQYIPYLNSLGFDNVALNGGEVQMRTEVAGNLFVRSLSIRFDYDLVSPNIDPIPFANSIYIAIDNINDNGTRTEIYTNHPEEEEGG